MEETYVVTSLKRDEDALVETIIYAGQDKKKAMLFTVDAHNPALHLYVWYKEKLVSRYLRNNIYEWIVEFDKRNTLERKIRKLKNELAELESELSGLQ